MGLLASRHQSATRDRAQGDDKRTLGNDSKPPALFLSWAPGGSRWPGAVPSLIVNYSVDMSATEVDSPESQISNFPQNLLAGGHHGCIRKNVPWIGTNGICYFGCRDLDVVCCELEGGRLSWRPSFVAPYPDRFC